MEGYASEREYWDARAPIVRFGRYLSAKGWWTAEEEEELRKTSRRRAIKALNDAEKVGNPDSRHLFTDVFDEILPHIKAGGRPQAARLEVSRPLPRFDRRGTRRANHRILLCCCTHCACVPHSLP